MKELSLNILDIAQNSVTARSTLIGIDLVETNDTLKITVSDDGCGMSPMDARMAFDRHATSKIETFEDVYRLQTFGFRGEALASIAAVAQVELRTRQADDEIGTVTIVNGGEFISQTPTMCPVGSQFLVRNLFYTAPARRKFNSDRTKMVNAIKRVFRQVALCNPQIRFELLSNDMPIITLPAGSLQERIIGVVGRHIKSNLLEVDVDTTIVKVQGYVGRPAAAKQRNAEQYLFVNGRYFNSQRIYRAIMKAYEKLIPDKEYPSYFLYLTIDPERVDVNVSPHKTDVHFADAEEVNQIVTAAVRSTLAKSGSVAMMDFDNSVAIDIPVLGSAPTAIYAEPRSTSQSDYNPFREDYVGAVEPSVEIEAAFDDPFELAQRSRVQTPTPSPKGPTNSLHDVAWQDMAAVSDFALTAVPQTPPQNEVVLEWSSEVEMDDCREIESSISVPEVEMEFQTEIEQETDTEHSTLEFVPTVVQSQIEYEQTLSFSGVMPLAGGYAIAMSGAQAMIVDLRRAKERVLYDSYIKQLGVGSMASQKLLFPERLTLDEGDYQLLAEHEVEFVALGFELSLLSDGVVELTAIPSSITGEQADTLLYELLQEIASQGNATERMRSDMARVMAVRGSRLSEQGLKSDEAMAMLQALAKCENYSFTPSGRSIMAPLTTEELKSKLN